MSAAELIRQDVLDLHPEPPRPPCPIPPRLVILACSATKAVGEGLTARDRYQGPLWQTLRAADPDGGKAFVCFVSAQFGLGDARDLLPDYDRVLTDADADRMVGYTWACYSELPQSSRMRTAAKLQAARQHGPRCSPSGVLTLLARELGQPFRAVAICGGHRYVRVASSWLPDFRVMPQVRQRAAERRHAGLGNLHALGPDIRLAARPGHHAPPSGAISTGETCSGWMPPNQASSACVTACPTGTHPVGACNTADRAGRTFSREPSVSMQRLPDSRVIMCADLTYGPAFPQGGL